MAEEGFISRIHKKVLKISKKKINSLIGDIKMAN